jgi:hypothetical protein
MLRVGSANSGRKNAATRMRLCRPLTMFSSRSRVYWVIRLPA